MGEGRGGGRDLAVLLVESKFWTFNAGNTKEGSITVPLTSC
jgi:hypothetical protein